MLTLLHDWQELASGLLALCAGAFIFVQGRFDRQAMQAARQDDAEQDRLRTRLILDRLGEASLALVEDIESYVELLGDVLEAIDRGDSEIELPPKVSIPRVFETIFAQLTTRPVPIEIYLHLSALLERGIAIDEDFRRLLVTYSGTVTEHRPVQPRLPLPGGQARSALDEPAAQGVILSVTALQEVASELAGLIRVFFEGEKVNGGNVRSSVQRMDPVQPLEGPEGHHSQRSG